MATTSGQRTSRSTSGSWIPTRSGNATAGGYATDSRSAGVQVARPRFSRYCWW